MEINHNNVPEAIALLLKKLDTLENMLAVYSSVQSPPNKIFTVPGAADLLGVTAQTVREKAASGQIAHSKRNGRLYFLYTDLLAYLEAGKTPSKAQAMAAPENYLKTPRRSNPKRQKK